MATAKHPFILGGPLPGLGDFEAHKKFMASGGVGGATKAAEGAGGAAGTEKDAGAGVSAKPMMFGNLAGLAGLGTKIGQPVGAKPEPSGGA